MPKPVSLPISRVQCPKQQHPPDKQGFYSLSPRLYSTRVPCYNNRLQRIYDRDPLQVVQSTSQTRTTAVYIYQPIPCTLITSRSYIPARGFQIPPLQDHKSQHIWDRLHQTYI